MRLYQDPPGPGGERFCASLGVWTHLWMNLFTEVRHYRLRTTVALFIFYLFGLGLLYLVLVLDYRRNACR
jgi:hypothetical protein